VEISKYIRDYLIDNPSVIVPHLGRFTAIDKSSVQVGNVVLPPVRSVEFDNSVEEEDTQLCLYISQKEKCSEEEAQKMLDDFYNEITKKLIYKKPVILDHFGILSLDNAGDIVFVPDPALNIVRTDVFGLKGVNIQPTPTVPTPPPVVPPPVPETPPVPPPATLPVMPPPVVPPPVSPPATPVVEPSLPSTVVETQAHEKSPETEKPATDNNESLFAGNVRVRENTERRKPVIPDYVPPQERKPVATPPPRMKHPEKKKTPSSGNASGGGRIGWVIVIILVMAGAGGGGYWYYTSSKTALPPTAQPSVPPTDASIAEELDRSADAQNALNPEPETDVQPKTETPVPVAVESQPAPQPKTIRKAPSESAPALQDNIGQGKYIVVVGSFSSHSRAESFARQVTGTGETCEVLTYGRNLIRVAVGSYDDLESAKNKVESLRSNRYCREAWVFGKGKP
jgi:nucleoid DNA-binding protein